MNVLVTGGAGFVGSILVSELLNGGHNVTVFDNLMYNGHGLIQYFYNPAFNFIKGDIRDIRSLKDACRSSEIIIHLAAIVGFPTCRKYPQLAKEVNVDGTKNVAKCIQKGQIVLNASTGSNYGALLDKICTEETPLNPLSLYGKTKTEAENILINECDAIALRFATGFGVSPRLRLDLLINDFVYQAVKIRHLVVYEKDFMRTFIHVRDMARAFLFAIDNLNKMLGNIYNCGSETMNYNKEDICNILKRKCEFYLHFAELGKDADQRNYEVSYKKIKALGYNTTVTVEEGIDELIRAMDVINIKNPYTNI